MPDPEPEKPRGVPQPSAHPTMPGPPPGISGLKVSSPPTGEGATPQPRNVTIDQNRYVIRKFHARGGMGEVWVSEDSRLRREVALKKLSVAGRHAKERFLAEAQVTGQLEHPGIVPVHDVGLDDEGNPFYIMKFVRGRSLKQAIEEYHAQAHKWWRPRSAMARAAADFCACVPNRGVWQHSRGVLHRDLKPDNIILGAYGETMLLDWGLARVRGQPDLGDGMSGMRAASAGRKRRRGASWEVRCTWLRKWQRGEFWILMSGRIFICWGRRSTKY